jgi:hypothetical protein
VKAVSAGELSEPYFHLTFLASRPSAIVAVQEIRPTNFCVTRGLNLEKPKLEEDLNSLKIEVYFAIENITKFSCKWKTT